MGRLIRVRIAAAAALVLATAVLVVWLSMRGTGRHQDGDGPLFSSGAKTTLAIDPSTHGPWSIGVPLCLLADLGPATITAVAPAEQVGSGSRFLGAMIRTFVRSSSNTTIISMDGYPPRVPDQLLPAIGAQVTLTCTEADAGGPFTELLIGLAVDGDAGGGWVGVDLGYSIGQAEYVLEVAQTIVRCGPEVDPAICDAP